MILTPPSPHPFLFLSWCHTQAGAPGSCSHLVSGLRRCVVSKLHSSSSLCTFFCLALRRNLLCVSIMIAMIHITPIVCVSSAVGSYSVGESRAARRKLPHRCGSRDASPRRLPPMLRLASPHTPGSVQRGVRRAARRALLDVRQDAHVPATHGMVFVAPSLGLGPRRRSSTRSTVTFTSPPDELEEGCFERPTPLLLVAGECEPAEW